MTKFTFSDVTYPDGTTGEIEASVKNTHKSHLTYCGYFTDDYRESLGYYQEFSETTASTNPAEVEEFCLEHFDERFESGWSCSERSCRRRGNGDIALLLDHDRHLAWEAGSGGCLVKALRPPTPGTTAFSNERNVKQKHRIAIFTPAQSGGQGRC